MKVIEIHQKADDGRYEKNDHLTLTDGEETRSVSLADGAALLEARTLPGLCTRRFDAELITDGLDYAALAEGDDLLLGAVRLHVTTVGKHCYPECPLRRAGKRCPLPTHCAFACVVSGGEVQAGMPFSLNSLK